MNRYTIKIISKNYTFINVSLSFCLYIYIYRHKYVVPSLSFQIFLYWHLKLKIKYVIAIHLMKWLTHFYDFRFEWTATAGIGIHHTKAWLSLVVNYKNAILNLEKRYAIKFCFKLGKSSMRWKLDQLLWPRDQSTEFPVEACWLSQTQEGQTEQIHPQTFDDPFFWQNWHDLHALGSHWTDSQQGILCWGFKGVQEEIPSEEASTLQIGSVAFPSGQCTSPQLHPCHRLFDQDWYQDTSSPSL